MDKKVIDLVSTFLSNKEQEEDKMVEAVDGLHGLIVLIAEQDLGKKAQAKAIIKARRMIDVIGNPAEACKVKQMVAKYSHINSLADLGRYAETHTLDMIDRVLPDATDEVPQWFMDFMAYPETIPEALMPIVRKKAVEILAASQA